MTRFCVALLLMFAAPLQAQDVAGEFDYYVMSLSWSPNWCALEGDDRESPQCDPSENFGWTLHGLWPQYESGWPERCRSRFSEPTRTQTNAMADIMGTSGLAWYQWNKHGVCAGLSATDYFGLARQAYAAVILPPVFLRLNRTVKLPASVIEDAFLAENPGLARDQITITCDSGYIQEARICLTRDLDFRSCGSDVIRDCSLDNAQFDPVR
jgi:ribonuclease T2